MEDRAEMYFILIMKVSTALLCLVSHALIDWTTNVGITTRWW